MRSAPGAAGNSAQFLVLLVRRVSREGAQLAIRRPTAGPQIPRMVHVPALEGEARQGLELHRDGLVGRDFLGTLIDTFCRPHRAASIGPSFWLARLARS